MPGQGPVYEKHHSHRSVVMTVGLDDLPRSSSVLLGRVRAPMCFLQGNDLWLRVSRHGLKGLQEFHIEVLTQSSTVKAEETDMWTSGLWATDTGRSGRCRGSLGLGADIAVRVLAVYTIFLGTWCHHVGTGQPA